MSCPSAITKKPWGQEKLALLTNNYAAKIIRIHPGKRLSLQYHKEKSESIYVLDGKMVLEIKENDHEYTITLEKGDSHDIPPNTVHRFSCPSDAWGVEILEVSTPHLDDVVRLEDDFGRANANV